MRKLIILLISLLLFVGCDYQNGSWCILAQCDWPTCDDPMADNYVADGIGGGSCDYCEENVIQLWNNGAYNGFESVEQVLWNECCCNHNAINYNWEGGPYCSSQDSTYCIFGCTDNWGDDGVEDCAGVCNGDAVEDCAGVCEGDAIVDECGVCNGDNSPNTGICDCEGIPNGDAVFDECGVCGGEGIPEGDCDCFSNSEYDECGVCAGDGYNNGYYCSDLNVLQDFIDLNESLSGVPLDIGSQVWENGRLTDLNLRNKQLTILPESIGNLSNLELLRLNNNQLTNLPESILNLSNLKMFYLHFNHLTSIPENNWVLSNLEDLWLYDNQLTSLPESICNLPEDCWIIVEDNQLCEEYHFDCIDDWGEQDCQP